MDRKDYYTGQLVNEADLDDAFDSVEAMEEQLAANTGASQSGAATSHQRGGILKGLVVTIGASRKFVAITAGTARGLDGKPIIIPASTVDLSRTGPTPAGDSTDAVATGGLSAPLTIAAGQEAWVSLYVVADVLLSDPRTDALGVAIDYNQADSFHFEISKGAEAASGTATNRTALEDNKVLLCDILFDDAEDIELIAATDAIIANTSQMNVIGYGPDDVPNLYGRRNDNVVIDHDAQVGDAFKLWYEALDTGSTNNRAAFSIRESSGRDAVRALAEALATIGSSGGFSGDELIGAKVVAGLANTYPAGVEAALQGSSGSVHTQLLELINKINAKLPRGGTNDYQGDLTITGSRIMHGNSTLEVLRSGTRYTQRETNDYARLLGGNWFEENFMSVEDLSVAGYNSRSWLKNDRDLTTRAPIAGPGIYSFVYIPSFLTAQNAVLQSAGAQQQMESANGVNNSTILRTSYAWHLQNKPQILVSIRCTPSAGVWANRIFRTGFMNENLTPDRSECYIEINGAAGTIKACLVNSAGTKYQSADLLGAGNWAASHVNKLWYLLLTVESNTVVRGHVLNGAGTAAAITAGAGSMSLDDTIGGAGTLARGYAGFCEIGVPGGGSLPVDISRVRIQDISRYPNT